jgi:mRNA interferase RelE/StbE
MKYEVVLKPSADKEFRKLPLDIKPRVSRELLQLGEDSRPPGIKKLRSRPGYRLRIGDYRVIYTIDDSAKMVFVLAIGNRRDVYR